MNTRFVIIGAVLGAAFWFMQWRSITTEDTPPEFEQTSYNKRTREPVQTIPELTPLREYERMDEKLLKNELASWLTSENAWKGPIDDIPPDVEFLIIELTRRNPKAILHWAWEQIDSSSYPNRPWYRVFKIVSAEWADNDAEGLVQFINRHAFFETGFLDPDRPNGAYVARHNLTAVSDALMRSHPKISLQLSFISTITGMAAYSDRVAIYQEPADLEQALSAWGEIDPILTGNIRTELDKTERNPKQNSIAQILIKRWQNIDTEGFEKSQFIEWEKAPGYALYMDESLKQISPEYSDGFTTIWQDSYDYHKSKYENPSFSIEEANLSESKRSTWRDLEFLEQLKEGKVHAE